MKTTVRPEGTNKPPYEEYPELYKIASDIARETGETINQRASRSSSECKYKTQFILEEVIKMLERAV